MFAIFETHSNSNLTGNASFCLFSVCFSQSGNLSFEKFWCTLKFENDWGRDKTKALDSDRPDSTTFWKLWMELHKYDWHFPTIKETVAEKQRWEWRVNQPQSLKFGSRKGLDFTRKFKHTLSDYHSTAYRVLLSHQAQRWPIWLKGLG